MTTATLFDNKIIITEEECKYLILDLTAKIIEHQKILDTEKSLLAKLKRSLADQGETPDIHHAETQ